MRPWLHHVQSVCRLVHHIGDEGKHLEELEEGTSHHDRERDSILAFCGGNVLGEAFGQSQCWYQGTFQDKTHSCETSQEGEGTASQPSPWRTECHALEEQQSQRQWKGPQVTESACHWIRFWGGECLPLDKVLGRRVPATG